MNKPTHEDIAQKAYSLWQERGSLHGTDQEIWLEAERSLNKQAPATEGEQDTSSIRAEASTPTTLKAPAAPTIPSKELATAEVQKAEARAPQVPQHAAPTNKPAPPSKPLWDRPHSA